MARGRFLSKTISTDREANALDDAGLCALCMIIPHLDRDGLITGDPVLLWAEVAPRRDHWRARMPEFIQRWEELELVRVYEDASQGPVLWFPNFRKHQKIEYRKEAPSLFVAPPGYARTDDGLVVAVDVQMGFELGDSPLHPLIGGPHVGLTGSRVTLDKLSTNSRVGLEQLADQDQDQTNKQGKADNQDQHQHQHQSAGGGAAAPFAADVVAALRAAGVQEHGWQRLYEAAPDITALDVVALEMYVNELNGGRTPQKRVIANPGGFIVGELRNRRKPSDKFYREAEEVLQDRANVIE